MKQGMGTPMMSNLEKRAIYQAIAADVKNEGEMAFPTSARVAMQVRHALNDPDCHLQAAAKLIQAEPVLSARIVAMANSVAFNRSGRPVTNVANAVSQLGFRTVRTLATALVTRQLAGNSSVPAQQALATRLWEHTAHVAALAHVLARRVTRVDPETALFAAIVHEVGGFYLLSRAREYPTLFDGDFGAWLEFGEAQVGRAILAMLAVPEPVIAAVTAYWEGYLAIPPTTLGDTLVLADDLAPIPSPLHDWGEGTGGSGSELPASIELIIGEKNLTEVLRESEEEVASLTEALRF